VNEDRGTLLQAGIHKCLFEWGLGDLALKLISTGACLNEDWGTHQPNLSTRTGGLGFRLIFTSASLNRDWGTCLVKDWGTYQSNL
jgi:hypothetical protein